MHIAIAGNIGSGKTTLTKLLARRLNWKAHYEDVESNPYLHSFYQDMQRWSFNLQIYFLNSRYRQIIKLRKSKKTIIQDRTIYEDARIFAPNLHEMGLMATRDFENYISLFELINSLIKPPDLLLYLRADVPVLVKHIQNRGREYEKSLRLDYLKSLNQRYESWIKTYKDSNLLILDVNDKDFNKPEDLSQIIERVQAKTHGLF